MQSVELFAGAGGLAMGLTAADFRHLAVIEWDRDACDTIRVNQAKRGPLVADWPLFEGDARLFDYRPLGASVDLVAGGPPCQPFSLGGKHRGPQDSRDMFPEAVRAVRELRPRAFMFENVKGLLRESFTKYFSYIILQLTHPYLIRRQDETWSDHLARLEQHHTCGHVADLEYNVVFRLLNACDFGVPQKRERVFIVGFRSDIGKEWSFPRPSHTYDALLWEQWVAGAYWERHCVAKRQRPELPRKLLGRVSRLSSAIVEPAGQAWRTVRDVVSDLPDPESTTDDHDILNHRHQPGARSYPGHTGSALDEPAKTLKAGDHGVPGGENMLCLPDGSVRYFTVREAARLQTFPDDYLFNGSWTETMRQLGNAVPVELARVVGSSVRQCLEQ